MRRITAVVGFILLIGAASYSAVSGGIAPVRDTAEQTATARQQRIESAQQTANAIVTQQAGTDSAATGTPTPTATITPTPNGLSRTQAVQFGEWTPISAVDGFEYRFRVTHIDEAATEDVIAQKRGNSNPPRGQKYIVVTIDIQCMSDADTLCELYGFNFFAVGRSGIPYEPPNVGYSNSETANVFGEGIRSDRFAYLVDANDRNFVIYYERGEPMIYAAAYQPPRPTLTPRPTSTITPTMGPTATCAGACG